MSQATQIWSVLDILFFLLDTYLLFLYNQCCVGVLKGRVRESQALTQSGEKYHQRGLPPYATFRGTDD